MTSKEMKSTVEEMEKKLEMEYEPMQVAGKNCFRLPDGRIIAISAITAYDAIVVEYAENIAEAKLLRFEDGDLFSLENGDMEKLFMAICQEIEQ